MARPARPSAGPSAGRPARTSRGASLATSLAVCGAAALALVLGASALTPAQATEQDTSTPAAARALARAAAALAGTASSSGASARATTGSSAASSGTGTDVTLALRDLYVLRSELSPTDQETADSLLARPTDSSDADAYDRASQMTCGTHVCVHWVSSGADAATHAWVMKTLRVMEATWTKEVDDLGYRRPLSDGSLGSAYNGGNGKFDVYLTDLGDEGVYGYCAPDFHLVSHPKVGGGYCVLDNDYAVSDYGSASGPTLRVTAAHEFFHAIQFAYDYTEDTWFMESTATWMEEVVADAVDDNRQYLRFGQVRRPSVALDLSSSSWLGVYGNWAFWQHLTQEKGRGIVLKAWRQAGAYSGAGQTYSTKALARVLASRGGLVKAYARFSAANLTPGRSYAEGGHWPTAPSSNRTLTVADPTWRTSRTLDHLTSRSLVVRPSAAVGEGYRLTVQVTAQRARAAKAAYVVVVRRTDGTMASHVVTADADGLATLTVPFDSAEVSKVSVTLVNGSTRYRCETGASYSCDGSPRDDGLTQQVVLTATPAVT
ncbi:MXAN_6640 family putative metalloprotease [Nocardioides sp. GY 10127]|uniref:MXAN_6640 family putative metalloprotease n=1 Tax=Nocardioides sp. GY 10127 TaxID=2569762 RepID=UPI001458C58A|nr:MXAN_6640 family putative metalloprotease [Nocardioides sp. GY 10127]